MKMIFTAIVATSIMTLFSVLLSRLTGQQFNEPFIIALLFGKLGMDELTSFQLVAGYFLHYVIGLAFVWGFVLLLKKTSLQPSLKLGTAYGFVIGLVGIAAWMLLILLHPDPPELAYVAYYAQLLGAHVVFGVAMVLTYKVLSR